VFRMGFKGEHELSGKPGRNPISVYFRLTKLGLFRKNDTDKYISIFARHRGRL